MLNNYNKKEIDYSIFW